MYVVKRDGWREAFKNWKIHVRVRQLCDGLHHVDPAKVASKVMLGVYQGVKTVELDDLAAETAAAMIIQHPDYAILAARIALSNLHKETQPAFSSVVDSLYSMRTNGKPTPMISEATYRTVQTHADLLNSAIRHERDFDYTYFGFKTLERSYLLKIDGKIVERPQHMLMRVAVGIHGDDIDAALATYSLLSDKVFTHASPTLFHAGTPRPQLASCFLLCMSEDSIEGIYETLKRCALVSKSAGGIGLSIHGIRATGSYIAGTNGTSNGLAPMLQVFNDTARYVDQGGNKRRGAFAVYLEPWHADIFEFLDLKTNTGGGPKARDLFYALWIPDLFMKRVEADDLWSLMCPTDSPGLHLHYGEEFERLYERYEREGCFRRQVKARQVWQAIVASQIETGTPYMLYKDACNRKSNENHLGTLQGSNLCAEIVEYCSAEEMAVCNLASIALPRFVKKGEFDFDLLRTITHVVTRNLNKIIDLQAINRHRPIGIGVQGLADAFLLMRYPFDSPEAQKLNVAIFETLYYAALEASCELAQRDGPYETFGGSLASRGLLQYDLWNVTPTDRWDWAALKAKIARYGLRNSLVTALMPTASTAHILGNTESIEPITSNLYTRRVLSGEFQVINPHLLRDVRWDESMRKRLVAHHGSVQGMENLSDDVKKLYRTVWEIPQKNLIKMAADRGAFIDQSQSLNLYMAEPTYGKVTSMHFYGWRLGLKTGMYYLRSKPAAHAIQFTVEKECASCSG